MPSVTSEAGQRQIRRTLSRKSLVGEGPITFDELMSHRSSLLYFKQFCVDDMSTEQLLFWLEVCDYQTVKSDDFRAFLARKLLRKYITPTSPNVLGLSSRHREEIVKEVSSGKGLAHAFDEAAAQVHFNLRYDVFPRFVQSEAYSSLRCSSSTAPVTAPAPPPSQTTCPQGASAAPTGDPRPRQPD